MVNYTKEEIEEMEKEMARLAVIVAEHKYNISPKKRRKRRRGWGCFGGGGGIDTSP